ncbi:PREDICTED: uncharacterized protein LOC109581962 [Amphimedon queenslandica]|uniref:Uncharacterized protein n=1 Tax=Amphimedon queenslandica TaxID=400682 RepID=A0AAN0J5N6_AMPQE|nr:PREDICTED: uncharacterized protein LOC109581962 [Amphimedon queenslandica]|eukprot:XP_019852038.1 PREDICTED: uncharacterized protein LOC109581962 [Amphimedon queenslandica]
MTEAESTVQTSTSTIKVPPNSAVQRHSSQQNDRFPLPPAPPKVSSVHPGKMLELSTTIGLSQYHSFFKANFASPIDKESSSLETLSSGGTMFTRCRGKLKSGRLRPLGLQSDPQLTSQACLGIVSVKPKRNSQMQRSLTAPVNRPASRHFSGPLDKSIIHGRRSFSAINTYHFSFRSASAMTGSTSNKRYSPLPRPLSKHLLPPVTPIEYVEEPGDEIVQLEKAKKDSWVVEEPIEDPVHNDERLEEFALEINTMSKEKVVTVKSSSKQLLSTRTKQGKLSHGWTESKPIVPLVGTLPPITDSKKQRGRKSSKEGAGNSLESPSVIDKDKLNVDVDAILSNS